MPHVAEDHGLDDDCGANTVRDVIQPPVGLGTGVVPGGEDGTNRVFKLGPWIVRRQMDLFEKSDDFFEFPDIQIGMLFKPMLLTIVFEDLRVGMYPFAADYGPIQLQEAAVGVIGKSWVGGQLRQSFDDFIVDAEVEQGIHHPGHGNRSSGTN